MAKSVDEPTDGPQVTATYKQRQNPNRYASKAQKTLLGHVKQLASIPMMCWTKIMECQTKIMERVRDCFLASCLGFLLRSTGVYLAVFLQLLMACNGARELYVLIQQPPTLPMTCALLFFAAVVPLLDTIGIFVETIREQLEKRMPSCVQAATSASEFVAELPYRALLPLMQMIDDSVKAVRGQRRSKPSSTSVLAGGETQSRFDHGQ